MKKNIQSFTSALLLLLVLLACQKEEATPAAFITLVNNQGYRYKDTTMLATGPSPFLFKITAKKGQHYLDEFGNLILNNTDTVFTPHKEKLVDAEREGFEKIWLVALPSDLLKGKVVIEFYVVDEMGKKSSTKFNVGLK